MKISDRIQEIVKNENISVRAFEMQIGCSNGVLARSIKNGTDISSVWVSKIIEIMPRYNATWLLTGKGSMLQAPLPPPEARTAEEPSLFYTGPPGCRFCDMKDEIISGLRDQVDVQIKLAETQAKMINYLEENNSSNEVEQKRKVATSRY